MRIPSFLLLFLCVILHAQQEDSSEVYSYQIGESIEMEIPLYKDQLPETIKNVREDNAYHLSSLKKYIEEGKVIKSDIKEPINIVQKANEIIEAEYYKKNYLLVSKKSEELKNDLSALKQKQNLNLLYKELQDLNKKLSKKVTSDYENIKTDLVEFEKSFSSVLPYFNKPRPISIKPAEIGDSEDLIDSSVDALNRQMNINDFFFAIEKVESDITKNSIPEKNTVLTLLDKFKAWDFLDDCEETAVNLYTTNETLTKLLEDSIYYSQTATQRIILGKPMLELKFFGENIFKLVKDDDFINYKALLITSKDIENAGKKRHDEIVKYIPREEQANFSKLQNEFVERKKKELTHLMDSLKKEFNTTSNELSKIRDLKFINVTYNFNEEYMNTRQAVFMDDENPAYDFFIILTNEGNEYALVLRKIYSLTGKEKMEITPTLVRLR